MTRGFALCAALVAMVGLSSIPAVEAVVPPAHATVILPRISLGDGGHPKVSALDQKRQLVYIPHARGKNVAVLNLKTKTVTEVAGGHAPSYAVLDTSTGYAYVANTNGATVTVLDRTTVVKTIRVGKAPYGMAIDPVTHLIYVANEYGNSVSVIKDLHVIDTVAVGTKPYEIGLIPGGLVYVTNQQGGSVSVLRRHRVVATVPISPTAVPMGVTVDPSNNRVYVADYGDGAVTLLQGTANLGSVVVGAHPETSVVNPVNGYVYVPDGGTHHVAVLDGLTVIEPEIVVGDDPQRSVVDPNNGWVYVPNYLNDSVAVIDGTTVLDTLATPVGPWMMTYDLAKHQVVVIDYYSDSVHLIQAPKPATISITAPTGSYAKGATVNASYTCSAGLNNSVTACSGTVASGDPIDTTTVGPKEFTVVATSADGQQTTSTVHYKVH